MSAAGGVGLVMANRWVSEREESVSGITSQPACLPVCPFTINGLEEGEEEGRMVLWRRGMSARAFSMTLKISLSYMLPPHFLFLPYPPCTALPPSVSAS